MSDTNNTKIHTRKLGPISDSEFVAKYKPFLDYAFDEPEVHNIAVTAPRGAGKSSVLKTYFQEKEETDEVLNISVGRFEKNDPENSEDKEYISMVREISNTQSEGKNYVSTTRVTKNKLKKSEIKDVEQSVEIKILNQIIQQIDPKKIPESKFHIDREHKMSKTVLRALFVCVALICVVYLLIFSKINYSANAMKAYSQYAQNVLVFLRNPITLLSDIGILAVTVFAGVMAFFKNYARKRIPKFTLKDCSIDPIDDNQDTMFNRYLDEILYMLINAGYKIIVFEDLDRLNDPTIWEKLRDINIILNKRVGIYLRRYSHKHQKKFECKSKKNNKIRSIKFVYVMNDSVFKSKDRVKFFEYIIPIIPIVDKSNSMDKLMDASKGYFNLNPAFLGSVNNYIDDMRLIYNIFNEMSVYKMQLSKAEEQSEPLEDDKLFAFVFYKNMLPQDYEKFQYNKGIVYKILNNFETKRQEELNKCDNDIVMRQRLLYAKPNEFAHLHDMAAEELYNELTNDVKDRIEEWAESERGLIKYLVINGYLTIEDTQYISYFYQTNMNSEEREFVLKVKHNQHIDINQKLEHVDFVIRSLGRYIECGNILNCDLVYYILMNDNSHENIIYELIKSKESYEFIGEFIKYLRKENKEKLYYFVDKLNCSWNLVFYGMTQKNQKDLCQTYAQLSLCHCDISVINSINYNNCLVEYLKNVPGLRSE